MKIKIIDSVFGEYFVGKVGTIDKFHSFDCGGDDNHTCIAYEVRLDTGEVLPDVFADEIEVL